VAGGVGTGVFQAAEESGKYAIGVDCDQALIIEQTDPDQAEHILTSMTKNINGSIYRALELYSSGNLSFGHGESLGIADGGVDIARNKYYEEATPADVKASVDQAKRDIIDGRVLVNSTLKA